MKTLIILLAFIGLTQANQVKAQDDDSWKTPMAWISKENAEKAKAILKKHDSFMYNPNCSTGWGGITISYLKKVSVKESNTGEDYYDVIIKYETSLDEKKEDKIHLDWVKIKDDNGDWVNLAKVMGLEGEFCQEGEE